MVSGENYSLELAVNKRWFQVNFQFLKKRSNYYICDFKRYPHKVGRSLIDFCAYRSELFNITALSIFKKRRLWFGFWA